MGSGLGVDRNHVHGSGEGFELLRAEPGAQRPPAVRRSTGHECSVCHYVAEAAPKFVPRLLVSSVIPDTTGNVEGTFPIETTDQSPMKERWGGWYVTGTHGNQLHAGNTMLTRPASVFSGLPSAATSKSSNVVDLKSFLDTTPYLTPHSDIVALMVLVHQKEVENRIVLANSKGDAAARETGEALVKAMLFAGAAPLTAPVKGTSNFAAEFASQGPRDSRGRSLRDFDLQTRLFRYPFSYLIYSKSFDALPAGVKTYVYRRMREILSGEDKSTRLLRTSARRTEPLSSKFSVRQSRISRAENTFGLLLRQIPLQKCERLPDDLTRCLTVVIQVKRVRARMMIHERHGQIAGKSLCDESIHRFVQAREMFTASSNDKQRHICGKIIHRLSSAPIDEPIFLRRVRDDRRAIEVHREPAKQGGA